MAIWLVHADHHLSSRPTHPLRGGKLCPALKKPWQQLGDNEPGSLGRGRRYALPGAVRHDHDAGRIALTARYHLRWHRGGGNLAHDQ